jgi:putative ABC transport system permease protein
MLNYYLKLSLQSITQRKGLSLLIAFTLGMGIAACIITYSLIYLISKDPLPEKSAKLFHIQLDNWKLNESAIPPNLPPEEVTWRDANNIVQAKPGKFQAANALTWGMITPSTKNVTPFLGIIRATNGDFFPMFNTPFLFGQGWQNYPMGKAEYVTVLSKQSNDKIFSGIDSVGLTLPMLGALFTVIGVLDDWHPSPKYFDLSLGAFAKPEDLYIPLQIKADLELPHGGNSHCWQTNLEDNYQSFLNSECVNFNLWVELYLEEDQPVLASFLSNYVTQQQELGRFPKQTNNVLLNLNQWLNYKNVVNADIYLFFYLAILFLLVCLFNAGSLINTQLAAKTNQLALRRALGANQQAIFTQCILEVVVLGMLGALIGLILSVMGLAGIRLLYPSYSQFVFLDLPLLFICVGLSLFSSVLAGLLPSIKICKLEPAALLT